MPKSVCDDEWIEDYDAAADAACYNDGLNYRPAETVCAKCKKTKKEEHTWGETVYSHYYNSCTNCDYRVRVRCGKSEGAQTNRSEASRAWLRFNLDTIHETKAG
jgi:hypothetical protein